MPALSPSKREKDQDRDLEMNFKPDLGKAVIEGKTTVPFQAFVTLVLQRKVFQLFKEWGRRPVIIDSELLTSLASAQQDSPENRAMLILTSLSVGILTGVAVFAFVQIGLIALNFPLGVKELAIVGTCILSLAFVSVMMSRMQRRKRNDKVVEAIESISSFLSK